MPPLSAGTRVLVEELLGSGFRSLQDGPIDTTTVPAGLMFNIFSSLAQFKRHLIQERTTAGLAAARARLGGRKPIGADDPRVVTADRLHKSRSLSIDQFCAKSWGFPGQLSTGGWEDWPGCDLAISEARQSWQIKNPMPPAYLPFDHSVLGESDTMSSNDKNRHVRPSDGRRSRHGWTELQRREGAAVLNWLHREHRLQKGFKSLSTSLRETLQEHVRTSSDAHAVWRAAPAVLRRCNDPETYKLRYAEIAYAWLHLLDRYVRTWLALEQVLRDHLLPMGKYGVRVLDVGTGPGPSAFATNDFYGALEDYARIVGAASWRQSPNITCVEPASGMNRIRHDISERLALRYGPQSVLGMTGGFNDFGAILPTQERRQIENSLRDQYDEYYDEERQEWHADPIYTPQEANQEANAYHRYRLFTFSNFFTTLDTVSEFQKNIEDVLADTNAGSVLLMIGAKGGSYPAIQERIAMLARAGGFRRGNIAVAVKSADVQLDYRLDEEVRWFYRYLKQCAGDLPASDPHASELRKELEGEQPISFKSSAVHAFRK